MMVEEKMVCGCGVEMYHFPEAYLCPKCDQSEIQLIAMQYFNKMLKELGLKKQENKTG